jgi:mannose-6-phosphate isomerase
MKQLPSFKDYLWGGERLVADYSKRTDMRPVAESWELSCHPDGASVVENGAYAGMALEQVIGANPDFIGTASAGAGGLRLDPAAAGQGDGLQSDPASAGSGDWLQPELAAGSGDGLRLDPAAAGQGDGLRPGCEPAGSDGKPLPGFAAAGPSGRPRAQACAAPTFPVLIKFIDAKQDLSLQVHPGDEYALANENSLGKNEMWYVVDCEPGASLIVGFRSPMAKEAIAAGIRDNTILDNVSVVRVSPGDCYCVPAGLLHAIGAGCLIAEIQQNSNVTYRVYDYGRKGADGNPRPLHVARAADVIDTRLRAQNSAKTAASRKYDGYAATVLADWRYFRATRLDVDAGAESPALLRCGPESFHSLLMLEGGLSLSWGAPDVMAAAPDGSAAGTLALQKGDCVFIPAGMGGYALCGTATALLVTL